MSGKKTNRNESSPVSDCAFHQPETTNNICLSRPPSACSLECRSCCSKICGNKEPPEPRKTSRLLPPKPEAKCEKCGLQPPSAHVSIQTCDQGIPQRSGNSYRGSTDRSLVIKCEREPIRKPCPVRHQCSDLQQLNRPSLKDLRISEPCCQRRTTVESLPPPQLPRCPSICSSLQQKPSCSSRQSFDKSAALECEREPTPQIPIKTSVCHLRPQCSGLHLARPPCKDLTISQPSCHRTQPSPPPPPPPPKLPCPSTPGCLKPGCPVNCGPAQKKGSCTDISKEIFDQTAKPKVCSMPPGVCDFPQRRGSDLNKKELSSVNMAKGPTDVEYQWDLLPPQRRGSDLNKKDLSSVNMAKGPTDIPPRRGSVLTKDGRQISKDDIQSGNETLNPAKSKRNYSKTSLRSNVSICQCPTTKPQEAQETQVKEESGCTCHYPPAFQHQFQCAGAITGVCCCSKNK